MKFAKGLEHQRNLKFLYIKGARQFTRTQKIGVAERKDKGEIARKKVDIDLAEVIKTNKRVLQMKRQLKEMDPCARNIEGTE